MKNSLLIYHHNILLVQVCGLRGVAAKFWKMWKFL